MEDLSTQIKVLLNKLSDYESLKKQDTEHRKVIRELQKENRELKQVKNNSVLDDVIKCDCCKAVITKYADIKGIKLCPECA